MTWLKYPDNAPIASGYYMTLYYNPIKEDLLYKALWYSVEKNQWQGPWYWAYERGPEMTAIDGQKFYPIIFKNIDVREFQPTSVAKFYTDCEFEKH